VEVGCHVGSTTIFLNQHMNFSGIEKPYIALDTFAGFQRSDIRYEVGRRGKSGKALSGAFVLNSKRDFDKAMQINGIERVRSIDADAKTFDFAGLGKISFALVDLDLYLPTKTVLDRIYGQLAEGGTLVVDDCAPHGLWDGAYQAYMDFVSKEGLKPEIVLNKLGIIKQATDPLPSTRPASRLI
jgi:hypothetical protein